MIRKGKYWIIIVPSNAKKYIQTEQDIKGKWLCFGSKEEMHGYSDLINKMVEEGTFRRAKIASKDPESDPFPHKPCVMCIATSADENEKFRVAKDLENIGLTPIIWKSNSQTEIDWKPNGKLNIEAELVEKKKTHFKKKSQAFISHASEDVTTAIELSEAMEESGVSCWMAPRDIPPGGKYDEEIVDAIEKSFIIVVLISDNSNNSPHVKRELEIASSAEKEIIPIRIQDVEIGKKIRYFVSGYQILDIFGTKKITGIAKLVQETSKRMTTNI